jgi:hypothetical protein
MNGWHKTAPFRRLCSLADDLSVSARRPRYRCHSSTEQQNEAIRYSTSVGADGLPFDPDHPGTDHDQCPDGEGNEWMRRFIEEQDQFELNFETVKSS